MNWEMAMVLLRTKSFVRRESFGPGIYWYLDSYPDNPGLDRIMCGNALDPKRPRVADVYLLQHLEATDWVKALVPDMNNEKGK